MKMMNNDKVNRPFSINMRCSHLDGGIACCLSGTTVGDLVDLHKSDVNLDYINIGSEYSLLDLLGSANSDVAIAAIGLKNSCLSCFALTEEGNLVQNGFVNSGVGLESSITCSSNGVTKLSLFRVNHIPSRVSRIVCVFSIDHLPKGVSKIEFSLLNPKEAKTLVSFRIPVNQSTSTIELCHLKRSNYGWKISLVCTSAPLKLIDLCDYYGVNGGFQRV